MKFVPILELSAELQAHVRLLRNQQEVRKYMYTSHEISEAEHRGWLESLMGNCRQSVFVIVLDDTAVGVVSLNAINAVHLTADWAFYLDSALQGKGIGSLVEFWMLDYAFLNAGLEKLNCEVLETNPAVIRMHQKFGFTLEGVRRKNIAKGDVRVDVILLGITRDEWIARRPQMLETVTRLKRAGDQRAQGTGVMKPA
jgi:UDP-4-amino-4,6-dideoxy-N-acetyl-beta-L-altrosamine N-acetyltransferase